MSLKIEYTLNYIFRKLCKHAVKFLSFTIYVILMHVSVIKDTLVSEGVKKMSVVVVLNLFRSSFGISNAETHR